MTSATGSRLVVALDNPTWQEALETARAVKDEVFGVKIHANMDGCPEDLVSKLKDMGLWVWVDYKLWDVSHAVNKRALALWSRGVNALTYSCITSGETLDMLAGINGHKNQEFIDHLIRNGWTTAPTRIGVTIPTDWTEKDHTEIGFNGSIMESVTKLTFRAHARGLRDFVCSPKEVWAAKALFPEVKFWTPGIRLEGAEAAGQARFTTPYDAIINGADRIVVGSPVWKCDDPMPVVCEINRQVSAALLGPLRHP